MLIPLKDENPRQSFPAVNTLLILTNIAVFIYQLTLSTRGFRTFVFTNATVPARFSTFLAGHMSVENTFLPLLTSMFLHSGFLHIAGNMLFLWIFGDNIEDYFGHFPYLLFYLICGIGSGLLHAAFNWGSTIPAIGASGAISGVMGAYLILFPRERILTLVFIFLVPIPAVFILVYWFVIQFMEALGSIGSASIGAGGGVAVWAHVGGFILGMLITMMTRRT